MSFGFYSKKVLHVMECVGDQCSTCLQVHNDSPLKKAFLNSLQNYAQSYYLLELILENVSLP